MFEWLFSVRTQQGNSMSSDACVFDHATRQLGGRFPREMLPQERIKDNYLLIEESARTLISAARTAVPALPSIHFDFVLNEVPNAFAFKEQGRYFIGFTTGFRYLLELVIFRMLADSRVLITVGDSSGESSDLPTLLKYARAEAMYQAGVYPAKPRDPGRSAYATRLIQEAILFLVGHEIAYFTWPCRLRGIQGAIIIHL